ncbi:hypothetical protein VTO73DRAFT_6161 [Trametes versicolor]
MPPTLVNLPVPYLVPVFARRDAVEAIADGSTLAKLATLENGHWHFKDAYQAVLCDARDVVVVAVYGAVVVSNLHARLRHATPAVTIRLWSTDDGRYASTVFAQCAAEMTVLYAQHADVENPEPPQGRGPCTQVFDGTNPMGSSLSSVLHPGSVRTGDIVRAQCHLVLEAAPSKLPTFKLHLESITVLVVCPEELPPVTR